MKGKPRVVSKNVPQQRDAAWIKLAANSEQYGTNFTRTGVVTAASPNFPGGPDFTTTVGIMRVRYGLSRLNAPIVTHITLVNGVNGDSLHVTGQLTKRHIGARGRLLDARGEGYTTIATGIFASKGFGENRKVYLA